MAYGSVLGKNTKPQFVPTIAVSGPLPGDTVTATYDGTTVNAVEDNGVWYIKAWAYGTYTVNLTATAGNKSTTVKVDEVKLYEVTLTNVSTTLNTNSWDLIKTVADMDMGENFWAVGDAKAVAMNGTIGNLSINSTYYAYILGFNHNKELEGEHLIHFGCFRAAQNYSATNGVALVNNYSSISGQSNTNYFTMNTTKTNVGGWEGSHMRTTICGSDKATSNTFYSALPGELKNIIQFVTKYTDNVGGGAGSVAANVTATQELCPLLSEKEISNYSSQGNSYEGEKQQCYQYYLNGNSKIKYMHNRTSTYCYWWTRTPYKNNSEVWEAVEEDTGYITGPAPNLSLGLAPLFCV